jgi:hypothetical protein
MILACCSICEYHEKVEIDCTLYSKCQKENCLSMYSNCVRDAAVKKFISENTLDQTEELPSAPRLARKATLCPPLTAHRFPFTN